jgi:hypothetical protein
VNAAARRRAVVFAIPMIIALAAGRQVVPHVRTVDFLLIFAAGAVFGVTLVGVIRALRAR